MVKVISTIGVCGALAIAGLMVMNMMHDPMQAERTAFQEALNEVEHTPQDAVPETDADALVANLLQHQKPWNPLLKPVKTPPVPRTPPDLNTIFKGISATRSSVGNRVKMITPDHPHGVFLGVGDALRGGRIVSVDDEQVVIRYRWKENNRDLTHILKRR